MQVIIAFVHPPGLIHPAGVKTRLVESDSIDLFDSGPFEIIDARHCLKQSLLLHQNLSHLLGVGHTCLHGQAV